MLTEFHGVTQEASGQRRWFTSDNLDLTIWYADNGNLLGFQLGYEMGGTSFALTWRVGEGFDHAFVRMGDTNPFKNQTPILEPGGTTPWTDLIRRFEADSVLIEPELRGFVLATLREGSAAKERTPR